MSGDLAIRRVRYARLDAIVLVGVLRVDSSWQRDRQLAVCVEDALMFLLFGLAVGVVGVVGIVRVTRIGVRVLAVIVAFVLIPPIMSGRVHDVSDLGSRNGLAKEVARADRGLNRIALQHARHSRLHRHLILGLLVVLNVEAAASANVLLRKLNVVVAQGRIGSEIEVNRDRSV